MTIYQTAQKAFALGQELKARGLPVLAASALDEGARIAVAFQLANEKATYAVRCPAEEATADWFEEMYRIVA
jgi:hypothetical protein